MPASLADNAMRFYTTEKLGPKQSTTPEGFLVCHDVPIARTGIYLYGPLETPLKPGKDGIVHIERDGSEIFRDETVASFIGKPVTNDHPPVEVTPANWNELAVGTVQNVRPGEGADSDVLLADLLITNADAIEAVRSGKREVSPGYDTDWEQTGPGRGRQLNLVGNHVALVAQGRGGSRCAIGDQYMKKRSVFDRLWTAFKAKDEGAFEEAMSEAQTEMAGGDEPQKIVIEVKQAEPAAASVEEPASDDEGEAEPADPIVQITAAVAALADRVSTIEAALTGAGDAAKDEESEGEEKKDEEEKKDDEDKGEKVGDSAALVREVMSRAEILSPGIQMPAADGKGSVRDALTNLRRKALTDAMGNAMTKSVVAPLVGDLDLKTLTHDGVTAVFNSAAELVRQKNNGRVGFHKAARDESKVQIKSLADINKRAREVWAR